MTIKMVPIEIIGLRTDIQPFLRALRKLACVQIESLEDVEEVSARKFTLDHASLKIQEERSFLVARLEGLLNILGATEHAEGPRGDFPDCLEEASKWIAQLQPKVKSLTSQRDKLNAEISSLPRYEVTLRKLLPIIPPEAQLPENVTVGVLASRSHVGLLEAVGKRILDMTGGRGEVVACDVDHTTRAMLIVFPSEFTGEIEAVLGQEDLSRLRLPSALGDGPPDVVLATLHRRIATIPGEIEQINLEIVGLAAEWGQKLVAWRDQLRESLAVASVLSRFGETDMTFVMLGWVPEERLPDLQAVLNSVLGDKKLFHILPLTREMQKRAPVAMRNPAPARPFESLVNLLALPRYGHIDPTRLMALFLPIFFGMILGDIGYGMLLLLISLGFLRKFKRGVLRDVLAVLSMGAGWAIVFGILFGEAFGTLGEELGLHPIWFERANSEHVAGLLVMTLVVGAVHITLGLVLGLWEAVVDKSRSHLLERSGMLIGLISLFVLVGVLAGRLPEGFRTPAWAGILIGVVLLGASLGWLGILMGPIEFVGLIGNVLSYLRIAAIGLASVYLAKVANDVAGLAGNVVLGSILAILIHALNLVLGAFSPTIHSLRLHYVEFFRKFYEGGGQPYKPFRSSSGY